ncbi:MAG TPA: choice-of-anchor tandem repeat GloVer-containing protein [Verrucomicrobiae bacterium]|nr:choice-of-anchor tandem repeat GloVer-containing protein [Verrucomicrobiae bacterium]
MKRHDKLRSILYVSTFCLCGLLVSRASPQTFTVLHNFAPLATNSVGTYTNIDGAASMGPLILSGNTLYGATIQGGANGGGTVFAVNTDGTGFKVLHVFDALENGTNSDGSYAQFFFMNGSEYVVEQNPGLVVSGGTVYGTTASGGIWAGGTVFAVNIDGSGFTNLHDFNPANNEGHYPHGNLVLLGQRLYGTTGFYGSGDSGTVFTLGTDGTGFTNLHTFTYSDGIGPNGLALSGNTLFGTTYVGGGVSPLSTPYGTVFSLQADGTNFKVLYNFGNGKDGDPLEGVVVSNGNVYGATPGLVFKVSADGAGFWILHRFESNGGLSPSGLVLSGNTLYGGLPGNGSAGGGTLFTVNTDGTGFTNLYSFAPATPTGLSTSILTNRDGADPAGKLVLSGSKLYGTTQIGGSGGSGTVFKIFFPPQLSIVPAGANVILTWPTNAVGFTLQSANNPFFQAARTNVPQPPIVLNGQNLVILPVSGAQQFYRLRQ